MILQLWILCARRNTSSAVFPHLPSPQSLFLPLLLVSLLWMSGLSVSQSDMISVSDITPRSTQSAGRAGGGAGSQDAQPFKEVKGKKRSPASFLWGSLITGQRINHPRFFSFIQLVRFPTPVEIPKVQIYSARSKSVAPITDKTESVTPQILRLWSVTVGALGEESTSPFRVSIRHFVTLMMLSH